MARPERYRQIPRSSPLTSAPRYWKRPKGQAARLRTEPRAVVRGHVVELGGDHSPTFEATVAGVIGAADSSWTCGDTPSGQDRNRNSPPGRVEGQLGVPA